ncbi:excisionase family DNA-binding protein [Actinophytocola gossypii]|uniref:Helix-turn-helix domain-containing protein n=1 Tax=Actinophytocola gossypii TaxID=2812003 RepID=A0ABT2JH09_9PSEU|nr:helix-turn-helix domain-containing protein [Actinophytocola gossypii]MCT2586705.1 helix-turn-helix domain-containing protein [Actinophytocola gossypii]
MALNLLSVPQAARELNVSAARVRELVHSGRLRAEQPGRELLIDADSLHHRVNVVRPSPGRPLSPRMAWALLWRLSGYRASWVSPAEQSRLAKYARSRPVEKWPQLLSNRAEVHRARMLPGPLARLKADEQAAASGVRAARHYGLDLQAGRDEVELYVDADRFHELVGAKRIRLDPREPNVLIRVPRHSPVLAFSEAHRGFAPPAAVAADLLDAGDERSVRAARQLLAEVGRGR